MGKLQNEIQKNLKNCQKLSKVHPSVCNSKTPSRNKVLIHMSHKKNVPDGGAKMYIHQTFQRFVPSPVVAESFNRTQQMLR